MAIDSTIEKKIVSTQNNLVVAQIFRAMFKKFNCQIFSSPMATKGN
jgi:hypothetical protein